VHNEHGAYIFQSYIYTCIYGSVMVRKSFLKCWVKLILKEKRKNYFPFFLLLAEIWNQSFMIIQLWWNSKWKMYIELSDKNQIPKLSSLAHLLPDFSIMQRDSYLAWTMANLVITVLIDVWWGTIMPWLFVKF
jgi:hypothetical protein